ncbi:MAG: hypothetical protein DRH89_09100 [Candidatus Cloacimonadota bacterium]|nr:MAG: hypothetical protein DRH89_09100 [Candidatus Cloacimonadota bacterium]
MFKNYFTIAFRNIIKHKIFSIINIIGFAIGLASCLLISLYVFNEISYEKFHNNRDHIYRVGVNLTHGDNKIPFASGMPPLGPALLSEFPEVKEMTRIRVAGENIQFTYNDKEFTENNMIYAEPAYFDIFSFKLKSGDISTALDEPYSILLKQSVCDKYFGNEYPVGKTLLMEGETNFKVTGILAEPIGNTQMDFDMIASYSSLEAMGQYSDQWGQFGVDHTFIMLDENSDENSLSEKLPQLIENNVNPGMASIITLFVTPFNDLYFHSNINNDFEPRGDLKQVYLFSIIAALIMLIACLNFMNLSTARSTHRVKEVGMRKVFGSNRSLLVKQFLSESVLTTLFSMLLGLLIFTLLYPQLNNFIGKKLAASYLYHPISLLLLLVLSILVGIIAGIYPAIFFSRFQPIHAFKAFTGKSKTIFRKIMVITQFTIAICLIIVTIFVFKQLSFVRNVDLGFDKEDKLVMQPPLDGEKLKVFKNELLQIPGVEMATICFAPPGSQSALVLNAITEDGEGGMMVNALSCDYDYIPIFNLKLAEGRNFSEDNASDANGGIIMNEAAIKQLGIKDPVGKELSYPLVPNSENNSKIIGVLKDFHFKSLREEISPVVLFLDNQYNSTLVLKYKQENLSEILKAVSQKWDEMIPETAIEYSFLDEDYDELYNSEEKMGKLFIFFSVLIVFIACLGIYGLAIFLGEQRTKEIGVRKVMGASTTGIMQLLSKDFTKWVIVANIIAIPIGYYIMNKWLQNFAYRTALSLWVFAAAGVIALIIALLTIGVQTYKTANLNPAKTLKYE